jgi:hypothetical protein
MKDIIAPVPREVLLAELTPDKLLRKTNKGANEIYVIYTQRFAQCDVGDRRLRELTFRDAEEEPAKKLTLTYTIPMPIHTNSLLYGIRMHRKF